MTKFYDPKCGAINQESHLPYTASKPECVELACRSSPWTLCNHFRKY